MRRPFYSTVKTVRVVAVRCPVRSATVICKR
jgi:hypothetical protein